MKIIIPRIIISKLFEHSLLEDPNECCGYLLGKKNKVEEIFNCKNIHKNPISRYEIYGKDQIAAEKHAADHNLEVISIYHSHTLSQAYPSKTDIDSAVESGWTSPNYVLISLIEKTRPIIRAFNINENKSVDELIIEHDGEAYISPTDSKNF